MPTTPHPLATVSSPDVVALGPLTRVRTVWILLLGWAVGAANAQALDVPRGEGNSPPSREQRARFDPGLGFQLGREQAGLLDLGDTTIVAGGTSYRLGWARSTAVDVLGIDGSVRHLPNLQIARYRPQVFRLPDGALVVAGGIGEDDERELPLEWLQPATPASGWQVFEMPSIEAWAQLADGDLVAIDGSGRIERLRFESDGSTPPTLTRSLYTTLDRNRSELGERTPVVARGLADGRLVIADGQVQPYRIAIARPEDADVPTGEVAYTGFGPWSHARDYETYDPRTNTWQTSAPARLPHGSPMQILGDGQVLRAGSGTIPPGESVASEYAVELSLADGSGWVDLPMPDDVARATVVVRHDRIFAHQRVGNTAEHVILRFDEASRQWSELWRGSEPGNERIFERLLLVDDAGTPMLIPALQSDW